CCWRGDDYANAISSGCMKQGWSATPWGSPSFPDGRVWNPATCRSARRSHCMFRSEGAILRVACERGGNVPQARRSAVEDRAARAGSVLRGVVEEGAGADRLTRRRSADTCRQQADRAGIWSVGSLRHRRRRGRGEGRRRGGRAHLDRRADRRDRRAQAHLAYGDGDGDDADAAARDQPTRDELVVRGPEARRPGAAEPRQAPSGTTTALGARPALIPGRSALAAESAQGRDHCATTACYGPVAL